PRHRVLTKAAILGNRGVGAAFLYRRAEGRAERRRLRQAAMAGDAGDANGRIAAVGQRGQEAPVDGVGHGEHVARLALRGLLVRLELDTLERDPIAAGMTVLAAHAECEREAAHHLDERVARDVLGKVLEVLELLGYLGASVRERREHRSHEET